MLKDTTKILKNILGVDGDGFVIRSSTSDKTIKTCNGVATKDALTNTCALCVALNKTVFKNNNKPEYYHPNCKCKNESYNLTTVTFDFPMGKLDRYLFVNKDKTAMMRSMGYTIDDCNELYVLIKMEVEKSFFAGNYKLQLFNEAGQRFTVFIKLKGKRDHIGEVFNCHIGCIAWPFGKIKIATPMVRD